MPLLPPHLQDEYEAKKEQERKKVQWPQIWPQWPSKYGPGGRRMAKAKRKKK